MTDEQFLEKINNRFDEVVTSNYENRYYVEWDYNDKYAHSIKNDKRKIGHYLRDKYVVLYKITKIVGDNVYYKSTIIDIHNYYKSTRSIDIRETRWHISKFSFMTQIVESPACRKLSKSEYYDFVNNMGNDSLIDSLNKIAPDIVTLDEYKKLK